MNPEKQKKSEIRSVLRRCRAAFIGIAVFSGIINVLMLTGSLFMLEVYDRVLPSRSIPTLLGLLALTILLFAFQGILETLRGRVFVRIGRFVDRSLGPRVFQALAQTYLPSSVDPLQAPRDLDTIRGFFTSAGPTALFDLPWVPLYLAVCFAFHPLIGVTALAGACVLVCLTLISERLSLAPIGRTAQYGAARSNLAEICRRNADLLVAMGMTSRLLARWEHVSDQQREAHSHSADLAGGLGALGRIIRTMLQSLVLAVGAYLVINQEATAGIIVASSILSGRALAPIDAALANWRGFTSARLSGERLDRLLTQIPSEQPQLELPKPSKSLKVESLAVVPPGLNRPTVSNINFSLAAGSAVGVIGPSGSGKSSLAKAIVGVWLQGQGRIKLDGAQLQQWNPNSLGQYIGYLAQDVELFEGTIAENIARLEADAPDEKIIAAARAAGVHDMIVALPGGYASPVGPRGAGLSAGQRQRVALARALYGDPFLVVLDEPNSNLDSEGDTALTRAIMGIRERKGIVVVIAHRQSALAGVDHVLTLVAGTQLSFAPKDENQRHFAKRELAPTNPPANRIPSPALAPT